MLHKVVRFFGLLVSLVLMPGSGSCQRKFDQEPLKEIIAIICPNSTGVLEEVQRAAREPSKYLEQFRDELAERGIEEPRDVDYWLALIDGLARRKCLTESDWKNCGQDLAWQLGQLESSSANQLDWHSLEAQGLDYKETPEFAPEVEKVLRPKQLALVFLAFSGDSYAFSIVPSAKVEKLQEAARKLSQQIELFDKNAGDK